MLKTDQGRAGAVNDTQTCSTGRLRARRLYEDKYRAKDPLVLGLGFAAARDLGAFLKASEKDDSGTVNPAYVAGAKAIVMGSSQSAPLYPVADPKLGFNLDGQGKTVVRRVTLSDAA